MRERKQRAWEVSEANGSGLLVFLDKKKAEAQQLFDLGEIKEIRIGLNESEMQEIEQHGYLTV